MSYLHLLVERDGGVLTIVLNRPHVLNALNRASIDEIDEAVAQAERDPAIGAIVITGAGERAFAAGADIRELATDRPADAHARARRTQQVFSRIERARTPVIAAVNGIALGGGCELAMACAIRVASTAATFGQPEINLGLIPGYGAIGRLPRLIGRGRALEWLLTGDAVTADEAWRVGLVNRVVAPDRLRASAAELATRLAAKSRTAASFMLEAVTAGLAMPPDAAAEHEAALFALACGSADMREGTQAFLDKRAPVFNRT